MTDITRIRIEDVDLAVEQVKRHYEVTAKHRPTGASVTRSGIALNVTRADALESLEQRVVALEDGGDDDGAEEESD